VFINKKYVFKRTSITITIKVIVKKKIKKGNLKPKL